MKIVNTVKEIIKLRKSDFFDGKKVGFVPTMGALHRGHLSLIEKSVSENDITIVSIFVNPRQFNDINDFNNYPITIDNDVKLLESVSCDVLFLPSNEEIYDSYEGHHMDFKGLDKMYEGEFRPGHFQGVVDIVYRLFTILEPDNAYFGQKDFQQLAIIKLMTSQANLGINIIPCPILREDSGLAMSSRNERLSFEERSRASKIYEVIKHYSDSKNYLDSPFNVAERIKKEIDDDFLKAEYVVFCDFDTLQPVDKFEKDKRIALCVAVWCNKVRLIDNIILLF